MPKEEVSHVIHSEIDNPSFPFFFIHWLKHHLSKQNYFKTGRILSFYRPYTVKWPLLIQLQHSAYESNLDQMYSVKVSLTLNILLHTHHIFRDCFLPLSAKRLLQCLLQPLVNKSYHSNASGMSDSSPEGVRCLLVLGVFQHLWVSVHY